MIPSIAFFLLVLWLFPGAIIAVLWAVAVGRSGDNFQGPARATWIILTWAFVFFMLMGIAGGA